MLKVKCSLLVSGSKIKRHRFWVLLYWKNLNTDTWREQFFISPSHVVFCLRKRTSRSLKILMACLHVIMVVWRPYHQAYLSSCLFIIKLSHRHISLLSCLFIIMFIYYHAELSACPFIIRFIYHHFYLLSSCSFIYGFIYITMFVLSLYSLISKCICQPI